jgi:predicted dehydrogenase
MEPSSFMKRFPTRRTFIKTSSILSGGYWVAGGVAPKESRSALEEIRFACIGVGGKGKSDSADAEKSGRIVAICDIDDQTIAKRKEDEGFQGAVVFNDYRKMLDEVGDSIDAVTVSIPDHAHAVATAMALRMGKACYTQKPLTRTMYEARRLAELAAENKCVTQMGNQGCEKSGLREAAAKIKAGCIGVVQEVHVWTNRPVWPQGIDRPAGEPVPEHIHWDEFIGPVEMREYSKAYHPFKWRGFWAFGTGALGDMACHTLNMPFAGCELVNPIAVQATTSGHNKETYPASSKITFEFAATQSRPALKFYWYDGGNKIDPEMIEGLERSNSGCLVVGDKGKIYSPNDYGAEYILLHGEDKEVEFVKSPGHFKEFANAIKAGNPEATWSNFQNYAGKLTEVILLGNLAVWAAGEAKADGSNVESPRLEWDQANLKVKGTDAYDAMIKPAYRAGYQL